MKLNLVAVGISMPSWVTQGFVEYQRRFPKHMPLNLIEIPNLKRGKNSEIKKIIESESQAILKAIPENGHLVILDIPGKQYDTPELAKKLNQWQNIGKDVYIVIGGPEGLSDQIKQTAHESISLSKLTLPHPIVRVIFAEALFRAWSLNNNHPYHRE